jgi:tRNA threonylcarbamoyladenosine biosynthesis protein TsaE
LKTETQIFLPDAAATEELGRKLASMIPSRSIVALLGPLGAGKTTFAKGFAKGLGVEELVNSPTFTMLNEYVSGRIPLYHLDLYRVRSEIDPTSEASGAYLEWMEQELDEITESPGVILIEWANFMDAWMAHQDYVSVELNYSTNGSSSSNDNSEIGLNGRKATVAAHGTVSSHIVEALKRI